jgi:hypothetical protein
MMNRPSVKRGFVGALPALILTAFLAAGVQPARAQGRRKAAPAPAQAPAAAKPAPATTAAGEPQNGANDADQTKVKVERGAGGKKIYKIQGEIVIEGKIQKPEAFYVLQKSSINYDWHELKQDFVPKILESVTKAPF